MLMTSRTVRATVAAAEDDYAASLQTFLHDNFDHKNAGMVIGLIDAQGSRLLVAGKLDNGTDKPVDGDTLFEIGSTTKTFTALLLMDMVERGEMKLDDPVAMYLPESVKVPGRNGRTITLLNLAAQDSGLPFNPDNFSGKGSAENYNTYTAKQMYEFVSGYKLPQDPGEKFQYSNLGMALLGHVLERKTGKSFESLVTERICRPLHMDSTRMKLTDEQKARFAHGHGEKGEPAANYELADFAGAGGLRSTANDLLKYTAANLALTQSPELTPLMQKMQVIRHKSNALDWGNTAMPWMDQCVFNPPGSQILGHAGGTDGYSVFIGLDLAQHRGVVVLTNQKAVRPTGIGWRILQRAPLAGLDPTKIYGIRNVVGLGVALDLDKKTGALRIAEILPESPASRAGLSAGLIVQSIDGVKPPAKNLAECLKLIGGPEGTTVRLALADQAGKQSNVELTRAKFKIDK